MTGFLPSPPEYQGRGRSKAPEGRQSIARGVSPWTLSRANDDSLQVIRCNRDRSAFPAVAIEPAIQFDHLLLQGFATGSRKRLKRFQRRAIVLAEEVDVVFGGGESENCCAHLVRHRADGASEERPEVSFVAPADGGSEP